MLSHKNGFASFLFCFLFLSSLNASGSFKVKQVDKQHLAVSCIFEEPSVHPVQSEQMVVFKQRQTLFFTSESTSPQINLTQTKEKNQIYQQSVSLAQDYPIGLDSYSLSDEGKNNPKPIWQVELVKEFEKGKYLHRLEISSGLEQINQKELSRIYYTEFELIDQNIEWVPDPSQYLINTSPSKSGYKKILQAQEEFNPTLSSRIKIWTSDEGIYQITGASLQQLGWDISSVNPQNVRLTNQDKEIPLRFIGEQNGFFDPIDIIEFWAEPPVYVDEDGIEHPDLYSSQNVYWLEISNKPGRRLTQEEGWQTQRLYPHRYFPEKLHLEQNNYFHRLPYMLHLENEDFWFYTVPVTGGEKRKIDLDIPSAEPYATQLMQIKAKFVGLTQKTGSHSVELYLNDHYIGDGEWTGNQFFEIQSLELNPYILNEAYNSITVVNKSTQGPLAQVLLDWIEIEYPKTFVADSNKIKFSPPRYANQKGCLFEISEFTESDISVYKKDASIFQGQEIVENIDTSGVVTYTLKFEDVHIFQESEYLAIAASAKMLPDSISLIESSPLKTMQGADYLMITPHDSLGEEVLLPLIEHREKTGLTVEVVNLHDIYNDFSAGRSSPAGIRSFLQYAKNNWSPAPQYVLLVGDGTVHPKKTAEEDNLIPVQLYATYKYGAAPADHRYALLDEDDYPDIAIGRLPVHNSVELSFYIDKIIQTENAPHESWKNSYLLIAASGNANAFVNQSENIIRNIMPNSYHPERLYLSGDLTNPYVGGTQDLMRHFENGISYINFRGHGGGAIWSDAGLLDRDDVILIQNKGKLPVITAMTCFSCDYGSLRESLGEALVLEENNGAAAFWGATGVGWVLNDYYLLRELLLIHNENAELPLGELIRLGKINYLMKYGGDLALSEAHQYTLLGDPASHFSFPTQTIDLSLQKSSLQDSDEIVIENNKETDSGQLQLDYVQSDLTAFDSWSGSISSNSWPIRIPVQNDEKLVGIRAYFASSDNTGQAHTFLPLAMNQTFIDTLGIRPSKPVHQDSLAFFIQIEDPNGIQTVDCILYAPVQDTISLKFDDSINAYRSSFIHDKFQAGNRLSCYFNIKNTAGKVTFSDTLFYTFPSLPDLKINFAQLGGMNSVQLEVSVGNQGGFDVFNAPVHAVSSEINVDTTIYTDIFSRSDTLLYIDVNKYAADFQVQIQINPDSTIEEFYYLNNLYSTQLLFNCFNVSPELGSRQNNMNDTIYYNEELSVYIPPGALSTSNVLKIQDVNDLIDDLPNILLVSSVYKLGLTDSTTTLLDKEMMLSFLLNDSTADHEKFQIYRWDSDQYLWTALPTNFKDNHCFIQSHSTGHFGLFSVQDQTGPVIEFQVNGQPFADHSYIPENPEFSFLIQDESPVILDDTHLKILLNDEAQADLSFITGNAGNHSISQSIQWRPQLISGNHTLSVQASDIHNNVSISDVYQFQVSDQFYLQFLGNHPNPFRDETVFVYVLTDQALRTSLKIYTVSGKLIRTIESADMSAPYYHEVRWDGRDAWGERVANGVYFFRLFSRGKENDHEVVDKVVKIR